MAAGNEISKMISEDPQATMEHAIANVGLSTVLGGVGMAGLGEGLGFFLDGGQLLDFLYVSAEKVVLL
jgi:hypothetical protein